MVILKLRAVLLKLRAALCLASSTLESLVAETKSGSAKTTITTIRTNKRRVPKVYVNAFAFIRR
jgi:hypothetical protein